MIQRGVPPGDILVLAPRRVIGAPLYEKLADEGIPVRSYYAEGELDGKEAQERLASLKIFVDPGDRVALRWLLGYGHRDWMSTGYGRLRRHCETSGSAPWEALEQLVTGALRLPYVGPLVERFMEIKAGLQELRCLPDMAAVADHLFPQVEPSLRPLRELATQVLKEVGDADKGKFLSELSNAIAKPEVPEEITDVRIMSLHKSKGLSAPVTVLCGCMQGLLPRAPDPDKSESEQRAESEEQRRLFYVGITRVKADIEHNKPGTLILTYSQEMAIADMHRAGIRPVFSRRGLQKLTASPFLRELGPSAPRPIIG